jgi:GDPmannose 4,6-dehydratase
MLQQENPDDYVLASGETHTIKHFVELSFNEIGIDLIWKGKGLDECGIDSKTNKVLVDVDKKYYRPNEVDLLIGDPSKAKSKLGWNCEYDLKKLVNSMMTYDLNLNP